MALAQQVSNDDVEWSGNIFGLHPRPLGAAAAELVSFGEPAAPALLDALEDPERFAVAHVLLTEIAGEPYTADGGRWNGLSVELHADGRVEIDPADIPTLLMKWNEWSKARGTRPQVVGQ